MRRGSGTPYGMTSAPPPGTPHPPPDGDLVADVAVVGAGVAGVCAARELVLAGADVVLLETDRVAAGVTGHAAGALTSLHGLCYARLRHRLDVEAAALYADAQEDALRRAVALCADLDVDADVERRPAFTCTVDEGRAAGIREEADAAAEAGLKATFVTETGLPFPVAAAVRVADQLQLHPRRLLLALADDVVARGGRLHEGTRVTGLHDGAACRLDVAGGTSVHARDVVLATHFPLRCHSSLLVRLSVRRELVVAASVDAHHAPYGMYLAVDDDGTRSVRSAPLPDGRRLLTVAGEASEPGSGGVRERYDRLEAWARGRLPGFAEAPETHRWAAQDVYTPDGMPCVGHEHPDTQHVFLATGFGGWGLSNGIAAGPLLAAHVTGAPRPAWTELVDPRRHLPVREIPGVVRRQSEVARHYAAGRRTAPRCTHRGCELGFDETEGTWECPCHGSRFAADGSVLQGPATRPLDET
ncbi:FAD-dependent oxidoreductase [Streptomyces sp. NPDC004330]|uniref:FAD-dependent oxidoreductase n=1 Tax=Streptomyces sp. NPDC004330 TaxID=3364700 RepID=UPI0036CEB804